MPGSVIVSGARTPIGKLAGALSSLTAADLGGVAIKAALEKAGVSPDQVDYVIMGQVLGAGAGQITARQAAVRGGIAMDVPAITINKVCLSGINALYQADQLIMNGEADVIVAGGMESMSNCPYLLAGAREGLRLGHGQMIDSMINDGLWCTFEDWHMGNAGEVVAADFGITRDAQDEFAANSHRKAAEATAAEWGLTNCRFVARPAERALGELPAVDLVIVDPPRSGLDEKLLRSLIERGPRGFVYVSCEPSTLARDLAILTAGGYAVRSVEIFDFFPQTYHVESLAFLEKVTSNEDIA